MLPLQMALARHPELWDQHTYRTSFEGTPFGGMNDILLRYSKPQIHEGTADPQACLDDLDLVFYPAWAELRDEVKVPVFSLMNRFCGVFLGRVIIARLAPGGRILPHADDYGKYALSRGGLRFHVCVYALPGCLFHCGGETIQMKTGDVYWFRHTEVHSAENNSADERIHLMVDMIDDGGREWST